MRMKNVLGRLRNWRVTGDRNACHYLDPQARVCRRSRLEFPCHVAEQGRLIRVRLGRYSYVSRASRLQDCEVGPYCSIGPECLIGGLGRHPTGHFSTSPLTYSRGNPVSRLLGHAGFDLGFEENADVTIGPDVWVGARVIVADGVNIGLGAIIGANTVVTKDVPPYAVVYGSPPTLRRYRFSPETIQKLHESRWWLRRPDELSIEELCALSRRAEPVDHS